MRLGIVGSSVAVLGSAAFAALAPSAGATAAKAHATPTYTSKATAEVADLTVGGVAETLLKAAATNAHSPAEDILGITPLEDALAAHAPVGPLLKAALPAGLNLADTYAIANSTGVSAACAGILVADCTATASPVVLRTPLASLPVMADVLTVPDLVITLHAPEASCMADAAGNKFTADANLVEATADLQENGTSILAGGPIVLGDGTDAWTKLATAVGGTNALLETALTQLGTSDPLTFVIDNSTVSHTTTGTTAEATSGELGLELGSAQILDAKAVHVSCGPNTKNATPGPGPGKPVKPGAGTTGEKPLGGIQSDEGRSAIPAASSWQALNGMP